MLCCGCKKPSHLATRTQLLDPSVSNNYLYQQHLHLHQQNQQNALAAAVAAGGGGMVVPQGGTQFLAPATTPGLVNMAGGQQRYVGNINYVMQQQHPSFHQPPPNAMQLAGNVVTGPNVQRNFLTNSSTAIFNKQPSSTLYSSMIFPQDGRQSRIVPDMVALQPESFRRVSGISSEVFRQIEAVEAEFDPSTLASQYAEMERRGEMIIRILNPASILPVWLEETCRRYGDGIRIPSWVQFVEVIKRPGQTLGLYIREGDAMFTNDGVYISRIALESPIYQSGCLRVGDEILAVNMVDVQRMSLDDVVIIMSIPRRLILTIRSRPLNATVEHMLPCGNRIYGSESYYDTVASDIYSRVDELRNKPVVVLKQQLEDEEIAAEAEAAEAEAAAEAVAAALDAATVCAEVGLLDAAEIAAASVDLAQPPLRHRSGSLDIYDLELKNRTARSARSALATNRRKLFANTADNLAELAMADAAYAYAKRRTGGGGAYAGDTSSLERPSSRLSAVTLPSSRNALMQPGKKSTPSAASSLYHGRLASRTRSSTGRLLRTSSDLFLAPDQLMDRALLQATGRRHSLSHGESDNPQLDFFLQRYNNLRQMRRRPQSLDRAYKSAMRNSFSTQTLEGFIPGMGGNDRQRSSRLGSMLNTARHARAGYDVCSDTEAYETPSSLMSRRAMTPSLLHATNYANRSSSLPRSSTGQLMMMMGGSNRTNRTAALNHRLAQLEQFYAATAAVARRHTLSNQIMGPGGIVSRPHSAMAGHYSDRDELGGDVPFDPINNRRDRLSHRQEAHHHHQHHHGLSPLTQSINAGSRTRDDSALATKLSRVPSTSAIYETIRKSKLAQDMKQADALRLPEPDQLMAMAGANSKTSSLPRSKGYGQMNEKTKKLNQELNARFQQATKQLNESYGDKLTAKDDYELHRTSTGPITSTTSRPLMIDPSGFQQYGPELRSTAAQHQRSTENQAGYSGLLVIHLLGVRGLQVEPSVSQSPAQATERNLYCVVECDRVYKARTVAVQSQESNTMNFDWDEIFDIDMFDTKEVTFLFYTWNPSSRHKLCSKGTIHLPWISTLRTQHVHAFEMRLYETPGAMLYIKLEFHDLRTTFKRTRKDTKQQRSSSRMGVIQLQNDHPLFGIELEVVLSRENSGFGVPIILKRCTEEIEQRGLHLVGIYRLCGSAIRKKNLREHFERNAWLADVSAESVPDINVITSLLKDYLRELPEPLFNKALFDMMDDGLSVCVPDDPTGNAKLMFSILECLSKNCRNTVLYLMDHIKLVHLNADRNKMTSQTLAICFGPLFSCHSESDSVHKAIQVFKFLLDIWPHRKGSFNFMKKLDDIKAERPHLISSDQTRIDRESNVNKPAISSIGTSVPIPNTTASRLSSETSMITVVGSKSGPIQISERNPFRGLVGSMNANTSDTSDYYTPGMRNYGDHNVSSGPSSNLATMYDSPPGSRYGLTRNTTTTTTTTTSATAAVTSSTSWISNSSGSSGSGRMLPSTQSATRTISTYSNTNEISHITVPAGATGPSILNPVTSTITSYRGTASYSSSYDHTTSSGSTISTHTMSSNHPQPYQSSSLSSATYKDTSSYYRSNHMSGSPTHDPIPTSTDYSRPYYSSSSVGANPTIGSSSINNRYPLTSSSSDVPMSTTGHHTSESIYSTVNKTGKTTDLYSNDTDTFAKIGTDRYKRDPLTSENDDYLTTSATTNYRSSNYLDRSNAITSSTTTTSSSYVQWSSTSDSSGIGSKYGRNTIDDYNYTPSSRSYLHGSTGSTTYSSDSNIGTSILSSTQAITSPPTRVGEHYTSRLSSSDQSVKPLIGPYGTAGTGSTSNYSSTQVYPTKFNSSSLTSSALSSTISTTSTVGNSNNSYLYSTSLSSSNYSNSSAIGYGSNRLNSSEMTSTTSATGTNRSSYSNI